MKKPDKFEKVYFIRQNTQLDWSSYVTPWEHD